MLLYHKENYNHDSQNHLNLESGFGLFKAVVFSPDRKEILWATSFESTSLKESLKSSGLRELSFDSVSISFVNEFNTLVPFSIFEESKIDEYLNFNFETIDNASSQSTKLTTTEAVNCFLVFGKEKKQIGKAFNSFLRIFEHH